MSDQQRFAQFYIDGRWCDAIGSGRREVRNPATGEIVGATAWGDAADADAALDAAVRAFPAWSQTPVTERAAMLRETARLLRERSQEIGEALTLEQGKPIVDSIREIMFTAKVFDYYADLAPLRADRWRQSDLPDVRSLVVNQPVGVVVAIIPWNYPVDLYAWKVAPALAAGCTVISKPSAVTPLSTALTVACLADAGFPAGVIGNVLGDDAGVAEMLVSDPRSQVVTATASVNTGRKIMAAASHHLKRVVLELGGQSPFIVLDDADLETAVSAAVQRSYTNMGQICIAVNRVYVANSIKQEFTERFVEAVKEVAPENGMNPDARFGPMATSAQLEHVQSHIRDAVERGGRLLIGGDRLVGSDYDSGNYLAPAVVVDAPDDSLVMTHETFGPLTPVVGFDTTEEIIARANDSEYGLAAYVYGKDLNRTLQIAERLEYGGVGININDVTELQAPFGGWKHSGVGRELGVEGLSAFLEPKSIRIRLSELN